MNKKYMKAIKKTLDNGVRVITVPMKDNPAVTVMVLTAVGSNNEKKEQRGIAHFLEHMAMKGGEKYPSPYKVSSTLDALGAQSNAFTGYGYTGYYAKGNPKYFSRLFDVLADVYLRPRLNDQELEKEKGVIIEEINMDEDLPREKAANLLSEVMFGDQPAGWSTLGTKEIIQAMDRATMKKFHSKHYTAGNTIVLVAGNITGREALNEVKRYFSDLPPARPSRRPRPKVEKKAPKLEVVHRSTDQVHFQIGIHAYPALDRRQPAVLVLNAVLGRGSSSRLFQRLREELGVCYYVGSGVADFDNYGALFILAGVDTKRFPEVIKVIMKELRRLREEVVDKKELKKAKDYLAGHLLLELESSSGLVDFYLDQEINTGQLKTPKQWIKEVRSVTEEEVQKVAKDLFKDANLNLAAVGDLKDKKEVADVFKL